MDTDYGIDLRDLNTNQRGTLALALASDMPHSYAATNARASVLTNAFVSYDELGAGTPEEIAQVNWIVSRARKEWGQ